MSVKRQRPEKALRDEMNRPIDGGVFCQAAPDPLAPIAGQILRVEPATWEYMTRTLAEHADISQYGADGWELVSVTSHGFNEATYYFKRPKA